MVDLKVIFAYSEKLTILYVEDNDDVRFSTFGVLDKFFKKVVVAVDGLDGLEKFKNNSVDLILTDINMPKMNGLDMIKNIRELDKDIPILILSAYNESRFFLDSIRYGVDGYILKPMELTQFTQALSKSIENIKLRKENEKYKQILEMKIDEQNRAIEHQQELLILQSRMACMGEMIDSIAHQWKQPLSIINMSAELITYDMLSEKDEIKDSAKNIVKQVDHMIDTMNEFRNFLRPKKDVECIDVAELLSSVATLMKDELVKHSVRLEINCIDDNLTIRANDNDVKHIFINLINNAKDEMLKSNIDTYERFVKIECSKLGNDKVLFLVKDNGNGVPEKIKDKIFESHFTTKEQEGGTGIGLYMSKQILIKYGGSIEVYNDKGAVFKIVMPS